MDLAFYSAVFGLAVPNVTYISSPTTTMTPTTARYTTTSKPTTTSIIMLLAATVAVPQAVNSAVVQPSAQFRAEVASVTHSSVFQTRKTTVPRYVPRPTATTTTPRRRMFVIDSVMENPYPYRKSSTTAVPRRSYSWYRPIKSTDQTTRFRFPNIFSTASSGEKKSFGKVEEKDDKKLPFYNVPAFKTTKMWNTSTGTVISLDLLRNETNYDWAEKSEFGSMEIAYTVLGTLFLVCMIVICIVVERMRRKMSRLKRERPSGYHRVETDVDLILRMEQVEGQMVQRMNRMEKTIESQNSEISRIQFENIPLVSTQIIHTGKN